MRRLEEVSLQPVRPPASQPPLEENDPIGLPSYEEAIAKSGQHDAPPPPYPGYVRTWVLVATFTGAALTSYALSWTFGSHWNLVLVPVTVEQRKLNQKNKDVCYKQGRKNWGAPSLGKFRWGDFIRTEARNLLGRCPLPSHSGDILFFKRVIMGLVLVCAPCHIKKPRVRW